MSRRFATGRAACLLLAALAGSLTQAQAQAQGSALAADKDGRIRTQLSARNALTVSSELAARVASLPLREGESFRAGQMLVGFDCALYQNQQRKAEPAVEGAQALLQSNQRLAELESIGKSELEQSRARLKEAQAEAASARLLVGRCGIAAPFAGRVVKRHVAAHQYASPGSPLLDIVETGQLELQMIVPSKWLSWLKPGSSLSVEVEELGRSYPAKVLRLGAQIDPVSQTLPVYGVMDGNQPGLLPGMSGWAVFAQRK